MQSQREPWNIPQAEPIEVYESKPRHIPPPEPKPPDDEFPNTLPPVLAVLPPKGFAAAVLLPNPINDRDRSQTSE